MSASSGLCRFAHARGPGGYSGPPCSTNVADECSNKLCELCVILWSELVFWSYASVASDANVCRKQPQTVREPRSFCVCERC